MRMLSQIPVSGRQPYVNFHLIAYEKHKINSFSNN